MGLLGEQRYSKDPIPEREALSSLDQLVVHNHIKGCSRWAHSVLTFLKMGLDYTVSENCVQLLVGTFFHLFVKCWLTGEGEQRLEGRRKPIITSDSPKRPDQGCQSPFWPFYRSPTSSVLQDWIAQFIVSWRLFQGRPRLRLGSAGSRPAPVAKRRCSRCSPPWGKVCPELRCGHLGHGSCVEGGRPLVPQVLRSSVLTLARRDMLKDSPRHVRWLRELGHR